MTENIEHTPFYRSIRFRLSLALSAIILVAVFMIAAFSSWQSFEREVAGKRDILGGAASVYAAAISQSVADLDRAATINALSGVRNIKGVIQTDVRLRDGDVFAQLGNGAMLISSQSNASLMSSTEIWAARRLRVETPIIQGGVEVGTLGFLADVSDLHAAVYHNLQITLVTAVIAILIGFLLAQWMIAHMTRPLRQLADHMRVFGQDQGVETPRIKAGRDETGVLANAFNSMIGEIRVRDERINRHLETLEDTVEARTHDLRLAKNEAEAANAAKSDFLATMSHEIRTPMNGMLVMAEMLSAADLSSRHRRYADIISRSGHGLLTIINDILDLSKVESGKLDLETVPVLLDTLAGDVASLFWEKAREKQIDLAVYVAPEVPEAILGDPTRLNQIVTNLVNNALKFTDQGGVTIRLMAEAGVSPDAVQLIMEVEDTGIGIPEDKCDQIFDSFSQADQTTTRRFGGTGLGLAVCKRLAEAMDGDISVKSQLGQGSVFRVVVPAKVETPPSARLEGGLSVAVKGVIHPALERSLADRGCVLTADAPDFLICPSRTARSMRQAEAPLILLSDIGDPYSDDLLRSGNAVDLLPNPYTRKDLASLVERMRANELRGAAAIDNQGDRQAMATFEGLHVLAAEDNAVNREVLREALNTLKVKVDFAETGREAVEAALAYPYDLIFMDGSMPDLDGFEATRLIRQSEAERGVKQTRIYALTAQVAGQDVSAWTDAGADGHITKPFTLNRLSSVLEEIDQPVQTNVASTPATDADDLMDLQTLADLDQFTSEGGPSVRRRVWKLFETRAAVALNEITRSLETEGASPETARRAHALKSMALSAGAGRLARTLQRFETDVTEGAPTSDLATQIACASTDLEDTLAHMKDADDLESVA